MAIARPMTVVNTAGMGKFCGNSTCMATSHHDRVGNTSGTVMTGAVGLTKYEPVCELNSTKLCNSVS